MTSKFEIFNVKINAIPRNLVTLLLYYFKNGVNMIVIRYNYSFVILKKKYHVKIDCVLIEIVLLIHIWCNL